MISYNNSDIFFSSVFIENKMNNLDEEDEPESTWNAPIQLPSSKEEGFENESTAFPVTYMKNKLENMRKPQKDIDGEEVEPNIFEQTNYKNIELFMTIGTIHENLENESEPTGEPVSKCDEIAQKEKDKKNPAKELKQIFIDCCDGVAAGVEYRKIPDNLSGDITDKKSQKYISSQNSRWLQSRMGEFFVLLIAMITTFSVMFYSSKTFESNYYNPMTILNDVQSNASWIQPLNSILELLLKDVTVPFTFLLSLGINTIPSFCNTSGLPKNPHYLFIVVFGIFFGLIWAIYQKIDWFLSMFFNAFEWKPNMIMFALVLVHILINIVAKIINPNGIFEQIFYRPKEFGGLFVLFLIIAIRILIALFLIPIAQMSFGFGFIFLFFVFPLFIGFLKKGDSVPEPEKKNTDGSPLSGMMSMAKNLTGQKGGGGPGLGDAMKMAGPALEMAAPVLSLLGISTKQISSDEINPVSYVNSRTKTNKFNLLFDDIAENINLSNIDNLKSIIFTCISYKQRYINGLKELLEKLLI